jgi:hypothetical protein
VVISSRFFTGIDNREAVTPAMVAQTVKTHNELTQRRNPHEPVDQSGYFDRCIYDRINNAFRTLAAEF